MTYSQLIDPCDYACRRACTQVVELAQAHFCYGIYCAVISSCSGGHAAHVRPNAALTSFAAWFGNALRTAESGCFTCHGGRQAFGSTTVEKIRSAGFDVIANPTKRLPHHYRLIHPDGVAGFNDENLVRLSAVFTETSGHAI
jgi:hypothetical protein